MCDGSITKSLTYLASPYSHNNPMEKVIRYEKVCRVAGILMARGVKVFSPIAHSHPIDIRMKSDKKISHEFWMELDLELLAFCKFLYVLTI